MSTVNSRGHVGMVSNLTEAVYQYLMPILLPVTDNLLFLNQKKSEKNSMKECAGREGPS